MKVGELVGIARKLEHNATGEKINVGFILLC